MSFAVVEYSSKSGAIWRHTKSRPNYLADPALEMDPTSFGCYVSAMAGEHIPLTQLVHASSFFNRLYRRITGAWPQHYSLSYIAKFNHLLVVWETANSQTLTTFVHRVKQKYPQIKIVGVPTQPYGLLRQQWQSNQQIKIDLQSFIAACDSFITIVKSTSLQWQTLSSQPVYYLPQPYPVEYATSFFQPATAKRPIIFISGVTDRPTIIKGHQVAVALQKQFPDHLIHVTATPDTPLDLSHLAGSKYEVQPFLPWREHLRYLASVQLVINTDFTQTRGRVQMDCAAVGTPSIGSNSDAQLDLFPQQSANPVTPLADIVHAASLLLADQQAYTTAVCTATNRLPFYNYQQSAQRINTLFSLIK